VRGNARASLFEQRDPKDSGWQARAVTALERSSTTALERDGAGRWLLYVSGSEHTRALLIPVTP